MVVRRCRGEVRQREKARQCDAVTMSERRARKWRDAGWITPGEYLVIVGDASMPGLGMCVQHTIRALEQRNPGAAKRIYRDTLLGWTRNSQPGRTVIDAMRRTGALKWKVKHVEPYGPRRCVATAKRTGRQCRRWAEHHLGSKTCRMHGGRGAKFSGLRKGDPILIRQAALRGEKQHQRELKRAARFCSSSARYVAAERRFPPGAPAAAVVI
jgi:hypothetical protein